ncbi:hypothetical protein Droror1_Dr00021311 [Drosera rotundifolia]
MSGFNAATASQILQAWGFKFSVLPSRYLGYLKPGDSSSLALISTSLKISHCRKLLEKLRSKTMGYSGKCLSYAGRSVYVESLLQTIQLYQASIFVLPKPVMQEINKVCRNFLWKGVSVQQRKSKILLQTQHSMQTKPHINHRSWRPKQQEGQSRPSLISQAADATGK